MGRAPRPGPAGSKRPLPAKKPGAGPGVEEGGKQGRGRAGRGASMASQDEGAANINGQPKGLKWSTMTGSETCLASASIGQTHGAGGLVA